ncbi:hypothetical protein JW824_03400 [bacterium]|nr:hypothetical protein [bacterium]RQV97822.1 MAG: hypothetical protein EH221_03430 [bacterium]
MKVCIFKWLFLGLFFVFLHDVQAGNRACHTITIRVIKRNEISIIEEHLKMDVLSRNSDNYLSFDEENFHRHLKWETDLCRKKVTVSSDQDYLQKLKIELKDQEYGSVINIIPLSTNEQEVVTLRSNAEGQFGLNYVINFQELPTTKKDFAFVYYTITDQ